MREAVKEEKRRRKYGRPLGLLEEGDLPGQALFQSPNKISRAQQRLRQKEEEEKRQQQAKENHRLQQALAREEKQGEKAERRILLAEQRAAVRAEKERQRAQQALARAQKQQEAAERKERRAQAREKAELVRKRQAAYRGGGGPAKRPRLNPLRVAEETAVQNTTTATPRRPISLLKQANSRPQSPPLTPGQAEEEEGVNFVKSRCGRQVRLPARFKQCILLCKQSQCKLISILLNGCIKIARIGGVVDDRNVSVGGVKSAG